MTFWIQQILNGLGTVGPLVLIAVSLTTVLAALRVLNIAIGALLLFAALAGIAVASQGVVLMILTTIAAAVAGNLVLEFLVLRPQRWRGEHDAEFGSLVVTLGVSSLLTAAAFQITHGLPQSLPVTFIRFDEVVHIGGLYVLPVNLVIFALSMVMAVGLAWFLRATSVGHLYRAVASNRQLAETIGIDINRVALHAWVLSGVFLGVSTVLIVLEIRAVDTDTAQAYLLLPFAAIIVGGMGSLRGTVIAALFFGIASSVVTGITPSVGYQDVVVFGLLFAVLILRPRGLVALPESERGY
jgi:branched-chain amino acid transport system permease protein